jgi:hypothetical protein
LFRAAFETFDPHFDPGCNRMFRRPVAAGLAFCALALVLAPKAAEAQLKACYYGRTDFGAKNPGTFELVPVPHLGAGWYVAHIVAEFVPYGPECTGEFEGVSGSWIMYATPPHFF